jgi:membrane protein implicated in regulation of membrane protease activity
MVSPILIAVTILIAWAYHTYLLMPLLDKQRPTDYDEATRIIGATGRVVKMLDPVGLVNVHGEVWSARSDDPLPPDTPIIVHAQRGLELQVGKAKRDEWASPSDVHPSQPVKNGVHDN